MAIDEQRAETLRALRRLCGTVVPVAEVKGPPRQSLGIPALDALLPEKGLESGSLVEWIVPGEGCGASLVALQSVRVAVEQHRLWAVIDLVGEFHPPAASGWGIPLESLLLLRPSSVADAIWTVEQCLRCPAVGLTWFSTDQVSGRQNSDRQISDRTVQRWKRAVEVGGGIGMLFRPQGTISRASWADVRWSVQPQPRKGVAGRIVRVELLFCRGCFAGGGVNLELHDATGNVRVVPTVADSTTIECAAGA